MRTRLFSALALWSLFFLICFGLGYPTLNRYDPGAGNLDAAEYKKIVQNESGVPAHFRHRILVPYLARPLFRVANGHVGSWDPAYFALLLVNSGFVAGTGLILFLIASRTVEDTNSALFSSTIYLLNFAVPNLFLAALVDSAEAFFLIVLAWALSSDRWWMLPVAAALGSLAKETFLPFALVFVAVWMFVEGKPSRRAQALWLAAMALVGATTLTVALTATNGHLVFLWTYAVTLRSSAAGLWVAIRAIRDIHLWYVFAWLLPLGLFRLRRLPREWVAASFLTSLLALVFTAYHASPSDAGAAAARPIFSIVGPLLSCGAALWILERARRFLPLGN